MKKKVAGALICATAFVFAPVAYAQSATQEEEAASQGFGLDEIIVTAQRRSESLQTVPVAVSAVSAESLTARGISDLSELSQTVPSFQVANNVGLINPFLRGVGSTAGGPGVENPIAVYVDGVYIASAGASLLRFSNIERVEVLKGPQGTLFGRNATGGLVHMITKDPTQEFSGNLSLTYGNYDYVRGSAYLAGGLSDTLRADISVQAVHQGDGYGVNLFNNAQMYAIDHDIAVRSKWVFEPTASTKFTVIGDYSDTDDTQAAGSLLPGTVNPYNPVPRIGGPYDQNSDFTYFHRNEGWGASLRVDQELGELDLVSITAYRETIHKIGLDFDQSVLPVLELFPVQPERQFSQEVQLLSPSSGPFTWVVGAYVYDWVGKFDQLNLLVRPQDFRREVTSRQDATSVAGFAQGTYEFASGTRVTLGGRYTTEKRSLVGEALGYSISTGLGGFPAGPTADDSERFNKFTFRIAADHKFTDDVFGYISFNRGFKSGGFNAGLTGPNPEYEPETLDAYEAGLKMDFGRAARLNLAGFYYDYKNLQVQQVIGATLSVLTGGAARLYGGEAEFEARVAEGLTLTASAAYLNTKFKDFPNAPFSTPDGSQPLFTDSATGNELPLAPDFSFNAGLDYRVPVGDGELHFNGNVAYNSGYFVQPDNVTEQGDFARVNASIMWRAASGLSISVWGKNLTDARVLTMNTVLADGSLIGYFAAPRTYGATVGYEF